MNNYGKGKVYSGISMKDILDELHVNPDFSGKGEGTVNLLFIHKKLKTADFYLWLIRRHKTVEKECIFRIKGKFPEIWDPQYGTVSLPENYHESDGYTVVKTIFHPKESLFFVFKNSKSLDLPVRQEMKEKYVLNEFQGTIEFEDLSGKAPIPITRFDSWTSENDPAIRYYSGKAKYNLNFNLPVDIARRKHVYISIDQVKSAYEIKLNGKTLGCSAFPGFRFDVSGLIREKVNKLEIRVANTWRNRIIGDFTEYGELKNCWTTSPVSILPGKDKPLQESGILGPVAFYY